MPGRKKRSYKTPVTYGNITYPNVVKFLHAFGLSSVVSYSHAENLLASKRMTPTRLLNQYNEVRRLRALYRSTRDIPVYGPAKAETTIASLAVDRAQSYNLPPTANVPDIPLRKRLTAPVVYADVEYQNAEHLARSHRIDYTQMLALMADGWTVLDAFKALHDNNGTYTLPDVAVPLRGRTVRQWVRYETPFATIGELAAFAKMTPQSVAYRIKHGIPLAKPMRTYKKRSDEPVTPPVATPDTPTTHPKKERFTMPKSNEQLYTVTHASTRYVRVRDRHERNFELRSTRNAALKPGDIVYGKRLSRQSVQFLNKVGHDMHMLRLIEIEHNRPFYASKEGTFFSGVLGVVDGELALEVGDQLTWLDPSDDTVYGIQYIDEDIS